MVVVFLLLKIEGSDGGVSPSLLFRSLVTGPLSLSLALTFPFFFLAAVSLSSLLPSVRLPSTLSHRHPSLCAVPPSVRMPSLRPSLLRSVSRFFLHLFSL
ncbi:hypothetical protein RJT34_12159 [Clitoria ternatea]|uniref:Transmembrane protein n=1 Tax=Clitoria ternatea TaxID=43366 RepID=A0AAN9JLM3_CLITE